MVDATDADLNSRSILNARVLPMDAGRLEFPNNSFDPVLCGFALFFFPDSGRVLREFHRVLGTGGRVALSIWGDDDHRWSWLEDLRKQSAPTAQEATPGFDTPEGLEQALGQAGFRNIEFKRVEESSSSQARKNGGPPSGRTARGSTWSKSHPTPSNRPAPSPSRK
ncbi:MAG: class I SAM-dependent methyltransferase [Chloroflexia bacterium]